MRPWALGSQQCMGNYALCCAEAVLCCAILRGTVPSFGPCPPLDMRNVSIAAFIFSSIIIICLSSSFLFKNFDSSVSCTPAATLRSLCLMLAEQGSLFLLQVVSEAHHQEGWDAFERGIRKFPTTRAVTYLVSASNVSRLRTPEKKGTPASLMNFLIAVTLGSNSGGIWMAEGIHRWLIVRARACVRACMRFILCARPSVRPSVSLSIRLSARRCQPLVEP